MNRILLVEDDPQVLDALEKLLQCQGYDVYSVQDGNQAIDLLATQTIDLILADVALPTVNGYQLCHQLKTAPDPGLALTPIILLSGRTLDSDIRYGKASGADDYLTKPLVIEDLLAVMKGKLLAGARLKTLFKRYSGELDVVRMTINQHPVRLDYRQHRAWIDEQEIDLTVRETYLFERLAQTPNRVVSIADMVEATHGLNLDGREASQLVRPLIRTLRHKLAQHLDQYPCIKNVRSRGYLLVTDPPQAPLEAPQRLE